MLACFLCRQDLVSCAQLFQFQNHEPWLRFVSEPAQSLWRKKFYTNAGTGIRHGGNDDTKSHNKHGNRR